MTKRTKAGQARHDKAVLRSAEWHENKKYNVKADLPGYEKPKLIGGRRPDMIAKKGKREIILEVERKGPSGIHEERQRRAFQDYADRKGNREFRKKTV